MAGLRALILDFGGVLTHPQPADWYAVMAGKLVASEDAFRRAYWHHRHAYDSGLPVDEHHIRSSPSTWRPSCARRWRRAMASAFRSSSSGNSGSS